MFGIHFYGKGLRKRGKFYYTDFRLIATGKRYQKSTGETKLMEAKRWMDRYVLILLKKIHEHDITLSDAMERWASIAKEKKSSFFINDIYQLKVIIKFFDPDIRLSDITIHDINRFELYLKKNRGVGDTTVNRYKALLKRIINYNIQTGDFRTTKRNPVTQAGMASEKRKPHYFKPDDLRRLNKAVLYFREHGSTPIFKEFYYFYSIKKFTGMRSQEILKLEWEDYRNNEFRVLLPYTKEKKEKRINVHPRLIQILKEKPRTSKYIIDTPTRSYHAFDYAWQKVKVKAGIKEGKLRDLRHTFATTLLEKGESLKVIGELLGHSSIRTTEIYAHVIDEKKKEAIQKLPDDY